MNLQILSAWLSFLGSLILIFVPFNVNNLSDDGKRIVSFTGQSTSKYRASFNNFLRKFAFISICLGFAIQLYICYHSS